jgi:hypothetical protein
MIARKTLIVGTLAAAALLTLGAVSAAPAAHAATQKATGLVGTLQPGFLTTVPATLTVLTASNGLVSVHVDNSTSTHIVRRYSAQSNLGEMSPGDYLTLSGTMGPNNTFTATGIHDYTIQGGFTPSVGVITAINSTTTQLTVRVVANVWAKYAPFSAGQIVYMNVTPAMSVTLSDGTLGALGNNLAVGVPIFTMGIYNRNSRTFQSVYRMRVLSPKVGDLAVFSGILQPGFGASAPTTLTLQTPYQNVLSVAVGANTVFARRYNGLSALAEFSAGDRLGVVARYQGGTSYTAVALKDFSIQRAFTFVIGQVTGISGTAPNLSVTITVLANGLHQRLDPFKVGQSITLALSGNTKVILADGTTGAAQSLAQNMKVFVAGVYDRALQRFTTVDRVRVMP